MRGGIAKTLRGIAQGLTTGKPERQYMLKSVTTQPGRPPSKSPSGTVVLADDCTRAVYKRLKKAYRNKEIPGVRSEELN